MTDVEIQAWATEEARRGLVAQLAHIQAMLARPIPEWQTGRDREVTERIRQGASEHAEQIRAQIARISLGL